MGRKVGGDGGGYALRSQGNLPPVVQKPQSHMFRCRGKLVLRSRCISRPPTQGPRPHTFRSGPEQRPGKVSHLINTAKKPRQMEPNEDTEDIQFRMSKQLEKMSGKYAAKALLYLREQGYNYELVKLGLYEAGIINNGARFHLNFRAKRADNPAAPVETFFAQLRYFGYFGVSGLHGLTVECCVSLGESACLPDAYERDNRGCRYCSIYVHHPDFCFEGLHMGR